MALIKNVMLLFVQSILFCLMMSCSKQSSNTVINNTDTANNRDTTMHLDTSSNTNNLSWLALGDSYTIGQSVNEDERFPAQTISLLKNDSIVVNALKYIATTGWTTQNLLDAIAEQNPQPPFDIVSLLIGVNDEYQGVDTATYRIRFTECLQQAIRPFGNKKEHVFVISIPDYSVTPFASGNDTAQIRKEIDEFNAINKAITLSYNISYTDITPLTREAKTDATLIADDGLHPSGKEYAQWVALLAPEIEKAFQ